MRRGPLVTLSPALTIQFGTRAASDAYEDHFDRACGAEGFVSSPPHRGTNPPESAGIRRYLGLEPDDLMALGSSQNARKRRGFGTLTTASQGWLPHH